VKQKSNDYFTKADGRRLEKRLEERLTKNLTKNLTRDLSDKLSGLIDMKMDQKLNEIRDDMRQWHSDIFDLVDGLGLEVRDNREFRKITTNQIVEDRERIGKLEKKVFGAVAV